MCSFCCFDSHSYLLLTPVCLPTRHILLPPLLQTLLRSSSPQVTRYKSCCCARSQRDEVSPACTGSGAEALGPHEAVRVASLPAELAVQHRPVPVGRPCGRDTFRVRVCVLSELISLLQQMEDQTVSFYSLNATERHVQLFVTEKASLTIM